MESADVQSRRDLPAIVDLVEPTRIGPAAGPCDGRDRGPCGTRALRTCFADEPGKCVPVSRIEQEQGDLGKISDAADFLGCASIQRRQAASEHILHQGKGRFLGLAPSGWSSQACGAEGEHFAISSSRPRRLYCSMVVSPT
ncbi:hypothetical protein C0214_06600 [Methylobacterium sp. DM1]|nr:hypothetical protein C0214_06600 [Methylobacterium sp. DM1]